MRHHLAARSPPRVAEGPSRVEAPGGSRGLRVVSAGSCRTVSSRRAAAGPRAGSRPGAGSPPRSGRRAGRSPGTGAPCRRHRAGDDRHHLARPRAPPARSIVYDSRPVEPERRRALAGQELERQDAHPHEVRAVDPLVRLGDDRADARAAPCPSRPSRATSPEPYSLPARIEQRHALVAVAHRRVVDERLLAVGEVDVYGPSLLVDQPVAQPDVAERAAHHHLVVAAAGPVRVEVERARRRAPGATRRRATTAAIEPAGLMWSVVTESPSTASDPRAHDVA